MGGNTEKVPIKESLKEYGRGITGGLLFSFPLLYTMEVWWAGFMASPFELLLLIFVTFVLLLGYNRYAGMRPSASKKSVMVDSVEEMGLGLIMAFLILWMLNRFDWENMSVSEIMGKTILEAMVVSIGVSIGTAQLGMGVEEDEKEEAQTASKAEKWWYGRLSLVVLAICGSLVVGGNVAPTEEVIMLAVEAKPSHILLIAIASMVLSVIIVFFSDFKGSTKHRKADLAYKIIFDTCLSYIMALVVSAFCLWFFGRLENVSFEVAFAQVVVLGLLASLGASAGRLLIK